MSFCDSGVFLLHSLLVWCSERFVGVLDKICLGPGFSIGGRGVHWVSGDSAGWAIVVIATLERGTKQLQGP